LALVAVVVQLTPVWALVALVGLTLFLVPLHPRVVAAAGHITFLERPQVVLVLLVVLVVAVAQVTLQLQRAVRRPQLQAQYKVLLVGQENKELALGMLEAVAAQVRLARLEVLMAMVVLVQPLLLQAHL